MRHIWKILIAAAGVTALVAVVLAIPHYRAKEAVAKYREQLKQQGEKMTIAELAPSVSADEASSGRDLVAAANFLGSLNESPRAMYWLAPGHALVGWQEAIALTYDASNCWPEVSEAVDRNQDRLTVLRTAVARPKIGFSLNYQRSFSLLSTHLPALKKASTWLAVATEVELHEKDAISAWKNVESGSELIRKYDGDALEIGQLVRTAMMNIQIAQTWEALQFHGWSEAQLTELQSGWESFNLTDQLEPAMSMDRAMSETEFTWARSSYSNFTELSGHLFPASSGPGPDSLGQILTNALDSAKAHMRYQAWKTTGSYEEEMCAAQLWQAALEAVRQARTNDAFIPALKKFNAATTNIVKAYPGWEDHFPFAGAMVNGNPRFLLKQADAETARRMLVTAIALERYKLRHADYPVRLEELTPDILRRVPVDFMDGKPLRYRRKEDGTFLLYSVGEDGKDDDGDGSPPPDYTMQSKIWYRMRDAVWPVPATADEVTKYEAEMRQKLTKELPRRVVPRIVPKPAGTNLKTN